VSPIEEQNPLFVGCCPAVSERQFFSSSMAKSRSTKTAALADLQDRLGRMKSVIFSGYTGLTVKEVTELRRVLRAEGVEFVMTKKTLLRQALPSLKIDATVVDDLQGEIALAFGFEDEVLPAKLLTNFAKTHKQVNLKGAVVQGQFLSAAQALALSKLPSREELLAKTVWTLKSPMTGIVNVLAGPLRNLLNVLNAYKDQRPASAGS